MYRTIPGLCGFSPTQLLMGRPLRTTLPMLPSQLIPIMPNRADFRIKDKEEKRKHAQEYDQRHIVICHKEPLIGGSVWVRDPGTQGQIVRKTNNPKSYIVKTPSRQLVRNSYHLVPSETPRKDKELTSEQEHGLNETAQIPCINDAEPTSEQVLDQKRDPAVTLVPKDSDTHSNTKEEEPCKCTGAGQRIIRPQRFWN
ncbi:unnamed protein product [Ixodes persulcatus]